MSLVRTAVVVAIVVAMLPSDNAQQERLLRQAGNAATWVWTFCDRNAETCTKASEAWAGFTKKAEFAATLASDLVQKYAFDQQGRVEPAALDAPRGTLTPQDLKPSWRGGPNRNGV